MRMRRRMNDADGDEEEEDDGGVRMRSRDVALVLTPLLGLASVEISNGLVSPRPRD